MPTVSSPQKPPRPPPNVRKKRKKTLWCSETSSSTADRNTPACERKWKGRSWKRRKREKRCTQRRAHEKDSNAWIQARDMHGFWRCWENQSWAECSVLSSRANWGGQRSGGRGTKEGVGEGGEQFKYEENNTLFKKVLAMDLLLWKLLSNVEYKI